MPATEPVDAAQEAKFSAAWQTLVAQAVRELILSGTRPDGRDYKTLRQIDCAVDVLPRVHGSAVFQRGETQALVTVTLGTGKDEQRVDGLVDEYAEKFMLHYYFPSFSVGEVRPIRGPGRREIGHGALAERSVKPVLPSAEDFPYTIRIISDILESNGSSSMATVCGSTLGLMAAGVPISNPVAGISIGLVKETDRWTLLTDIIGDEDHYGDMDFKVAGTQNGITGIQLDLKINGISEEIVVATLTQAREARIEILRKMLTTISRPRPEISPSAPRLLQTHIDPEKIGLLIGPGGKMIRSIQEITGASIEVEDDGTVTVASSGMEGAEEALRRIEALTATVEMGRIYTGRVVQHQGFRRVHRDPARQGRPVPHQRAGRRLRFQRGRDLQSGRRDAGEGDPHRRPGPREAQPQGRPEGAWHCRRQGAGRRRRTSAARTASVKVAAKAAATAIATATAAAAATATAAAAVESEIQISNLKYKFEVRNVNDE